MNENVKYSYGKQNITEEEITAVVEVLRSEWLTTGPAVKNFERNLSNYFGSLHTCVVSSGTAALHLVALGLGWGPDDIVITTPITFLATANSVVYVGAMPEFVDIDPISYTIDPNQVEDKIKNLIKQRKKPKAIIGVDYAGHPCDWKSLRAISNKYNLDLVNDNCHALGAKYFRNKQYAAKYADAVTQSFHAVKHITTGEGGAILTNNSKLYEKVEILRNHGIDRKNIPNKFKNSSLYYEMHHLGFNYRLTDFQCALGSKQLESLDEKVKKRKKISQIYNELFLDHQLIKIPQENNNIDHSFHLYPLQLDFELMKIKKNDYFQIMKNNGIFLQVHYIPVHTQPFYQKKYKYKFGDFPKAENFYKSVISLPLYPELSTNDIEYITSNVIKNTKSK